MQFGSFTITLDSEQLFPEFMVRRFNLRRATKIKNEDAIRGVTQLHFTCWPDFGVPEEASSMLKFVRHVRRHVTPAQGPMVVHCSAGVGRTGTFIAIDILLQRMQEVGGVINVQEVVCRMRAQRGNMVQTNVSAFVIGRTLYHMCNTRWFQHNGPFTVIAQFYRRSICLSMTLCYMLIPMGSLRSKARS